MESVPQRSILGPLLSMQYVNDIITATNITPIVLFADDKTIHVSLILIPIKYLINNEPKELYKLFKANMFTVNASKTNYMLLGSSHKTEMNHDNILTMLDKMNLDQVTHVVSENSYT